MNDKEMLTLIHDMLMNGHTKKQIIDKIQEVKGVGKSQSYRIFDKFMTCGEFFKNKKDVKESIKKSLYIMYMSAAGKNYARAAVEVLDRLLLVCPWIKDEDEIKKDTEINLIIKEWVGENEDKVQDLITETDKKPEE